MWLYRGGAWGEWNDNCCQRGSRRGEGESKCSSIGVEPGESGMTTAVREAHEEVRERVSVTL